MMESWKKIEASSKEIAFILLPNSILSASLWTLFMCRLAIISEISKEWQRILEDEIHSRSLNHELTQRQRLFREFFHSRAAGESFIIHRETLFNLNRNLINIWVSMNDSMLRVKALSKGRPITNKDKISTKILWVLPLSAFPIDRGVVLWKSECI
jgi:hypothetical protein